jgi:hypothetical protein
MANKFLAKSSKLSLNQQAIMGLAKLLAILVIVGVVGYSEVMFIQVISRAFPDGVFKIIAMIGGVSTGLSVLTLLLAKAYWFRPGGQEIAAWAFTGVEVLILMLNVLLSFALASGPLKTSDPFYTWYTLCPSSPLFALVGWTILIMLDSSQRERHDYMEMEDEVRSAELQHEKSVHAARMKLRTTILETHVTYMEEFTDSPEMQESIKKAARVMATEELSSFIGRSVTAMRGQVPASSANNLLPSGPSTTDSLDGVFTDIDSRVPGASGAVPADGDIYNAGLSATDSRSKVKFTSHERRPGS